MTLILGPFIIISIDMKNFSEKIHLYLSLFIPGVSLFLGGIIIVSDKTYIGKHALFMIQKKGEEICAKVYTFSRLY